MTKRERVLVWAMAGAIAWGGSTVVHGIIRDNLKSSRGDREQTEIRAFAEAQRAKVAGLRLSVGEKNALNAAAEEWAASPFLPQGSIARRAMDRAQEFRYSGYIKSGSRPFAIINGREYRVSDTVAASDFVVEDILPDHLILVSSGGGRRITVALQSSIAKGELP